jgi:hypothetical protein
MSPLFEFQQSLEKIKKNVQVRLSTIEFLGKMSWQKELEGTLGR